MLVGGGDEGLRALTEAGVVRFTGAYYHSKEFDATFAVCDLLVGPAADASRKNLKKLP